ncbi:MAG: NAD(+) synthase [Oscillospiraceae bacterium]|nr:NAD(+) synthase [Oscillospiraceae bacterium]
MLDFIRIGCAVPPVRVGDVKKNTADICRSIQAANDRGCDLVVFPELALTGYTCADLFFQEALLSAVKEGLRSITACTEQFSGLTVAVGLPAMIGGHLYNCGALISDGKVRGLVPKTFIPNSNEFSEGRWFSSSEALDCCEVDALALGLEESYCVSVGRDLLFQIGDSAMVGLELCEDLWSPLPPSTLLAVNGAEIILNLSASNELVGKRVYRRELVKHQSSACNCIYAFCSSGYTESTQDLIFSGHSILAENGTILAENQETLATDYLLVADLDLGKIRADRRRNKSFQEAANIYGALQTVDVVAWDAPALRSDGSLATVKRLPFVPDTQANRRERCLEIFQMQVAGLKQRLSTIGTNAVIGVSGGLDSTLALLVCVEAMRQLGRPAADVYAVTMPCFGTSDRTYNNAWELMRTLGVGGKEINIKNAVTLHFQDIGHDISVHNGTYENAQARERTQILMDYASVVGGIVVGTGDLSELALGWCTYNGDHMSMYSVNGSVPKTLMRWMIETIAELPAFTASKAVLLDILDTPISPELLPPDAEGKISQQTEDLVGPYALHDFFLFHMLRYGFAPKKIFALACRAFAESFDADTIKKWLRVFYRRFFTQQFKRNCAPDGVKVGSVSLGPRGDWKMPSDASGRLWLDEIDTL